LGAKARKQVISTANHANHANHAIFRLPGRRLAIRLVSVICGWRWLLCDTRFLPSLGERFRHQAFDSVHWLILALAPPTIIRWGSPLGRECEP